MIWKEDKILQAEVGFETDTKKFYREILKQSTDIKKTPTMKEAEDFWKKISSNEKKTQRESRMDHEKRREDKKTLHKKNGHISNWNSSNM